MCTTVPTGVWMPSPTPSGMLCDTSRNSIRKGPSLRSLSGETSFSDTFPCKPVLAELGVDEPQGQTRTVHGHVDLLQQVGQRAHMVFVAVGDEYAEHAVLVLDHVGEVGQDQIDAQHIVVGEHEAGIDDKQGVAVLQNHHVLADGPQSAQGYDFERLSRHRWWLEPPRRSRLATSPGALSPYGSERGACSIGCSPDRQRVLAARARA